MNKHIAIICVLFTLPISTANAQNKWYNRLAHWVGGEGWKMEECLPTTHTKYLFQVGSRSTIDEYLSPIAHNGINGQVSFLTDFSSPIDYKWHLYQEVLISTANMENKANKSKMYGIELQYSLGPSWRLIRYKGITLDLAPLASLSVKGNFKLSNTNNVGSAKGSLGVDAWARVKYQTPWKVLPIAVSYSAQVPLVQGAFHPEYGQSYYDYISGENGSKLAFKLGSLHNTIGISQRLLIDLPIHNLTLTLGAEHRYFSQKLNYLPYKEGSWGIILGVSVDMASFSGGGALKSSDIHSTYY